MPSKFCFVMVSVGDTDAKQCDTPATIKCGDFWFCVAHYDLFHGDSQCHHIVPRD